VHLLVLLLYISPCVYKNDQIFFTFQILGEKLKYNVTAHQLFIETTKPMSLLWQKYYTFIITFIAAFYVRMFLWNLPLRRSKKIKRERKWMVHISFWSKLVINLLGENINTTTQGLQILGARMPRWLNFVWWRLIFPAQLMNFFSSCMKHLKFTAYFCHWQLWHYMLLTGTHSFYLMQVNSSQPNRTSPVNERGRSAEYHTASCHFQELCFILK
jgi:hypothetical protein